MGDHPRPRLLRHAAARQHRVDGERFVILHDARQGRQWKLGWREWQVITQADGTRDYEGIREACRQQGIKTSVEQIRAFLSELAREGLVGEQDDTSIASALAPPLPIKEMPNYRLQCAGDGFCCRLFSSVHFTALEVARAQSTCPELEAVGHDPTQLFLPAHGLDRRLLTVASKHGACAYLQPDGLCQLHGVAGPDAKPLGCRTFPIRHIEDGKHIRVTAAPECDCVFRSAKKSLVVTTNQNAQSGRDLPDQIWVDSVPKEVQVGGRTITRSRWLRWSEELVLPPDTLDPAGWLLSLSQSLDRGEMPTEASIAWPDLRNEITTLAKKLQTQWRKESDWRAKDDLLMRTLPWLINACDALLTSRPEPRDLPSEHFYLRVLHHGHLWLDDDRPFENAIRSRAIRLLIARAVPQETMDVTQYPLALVEATLRAYA